MGVNTRPDHFFLYDIGPSTPHPQCGEEGGGESFGEKNISPLLISPSKRKSGSGRLVSRGGNYLGWN
jgi:hypothetical protein